MKRAVFLLCIGLLAVPCLSQETFNKRHHFGYINAALCSIFPTDSCYYATGIIVDTLFPNFVGSIFVKFDLGGNEVFNNPLTSNSKYYNTWFGDLIRTQDGHFLDIGQTSDTIPRGLILKYNNEGDTLATKEFLSPYHLTNTFIVPVQVLETKTGDILVLSSIAKPGADADPCLSVYGPNLELKHHFTYGTDEYEVPENMIFDGDNHVIIGAERSSGYFINTNLWGKTWLFRVNISDGSTDWEYLSPNNNDVLQNKANELRIDEHGGLVTATSRGYEEPVNDLVSIPYWESAYFFKIDSNQQLVWELEVFDSVRPSPGNKMNRMIKVDGENTFVACGMFNLIRSIEPPVGGDFAWFFKFNDDGELLWLRKHQILEEVGHRHRIYDLKQTPDGGLIAAGEIRGNFGDGTPGLQGWLLKLDEHGCLIPGCEANDTVTSSIELPVEVPVQLAVHPNPASDYLNFQLRTQQAVRQAVFRIVDAGGRVVREIESSLPRETHILPVYDWPEGTYYLQYLNNNQIIHTETFIIHRQ